LLSTACVHVHLCTVQKACIMRAYEVDVHTKNIFNTHKMTTEKTNAVAVKPQEGGTLLQQYNREIEKQLVDPATCAQLLATTFKGLSAPAMRGALLAGRMLGFDFEHFLRKDIYAVGYGDSYSLVTSIGYTRKVSMRSGVVGVKKPVYTYKENGKLHSASVTVLRNFGGYIGEFESEVFFDEYYAGNKKPDGGVKRRKGKDGSWYDMGETLWDTKPHTMLAKVAEMHSHRKACPEETQNLYIEEELEKRGENEFVQRFAHAVDEAKAITMGNLTKHGEEDQTPPDEKIDTIKA